MGLSQKQVFVFQCNWILLCHSRLSFEYQSQDPVFSVQTLPVNWTANSIFDTNQLHN